MNKSLSSCILFLLSSFNINPWKSRGGVARLEPICWARLSARKVRELCPTTKSIRTQTWSSFRECFACIENSFACRCVGYYWERDGNNLSPGNRLWRLRTCKSKKHLCSKMMKLILLNGILLILCFMKIPNVRATTSKRKTQLQKRTAPLIQLSIKSDNIFILSFDSSVRSW